ncbi:MAG TPA: hypothetical protein VH834_21880 [Solirubrobacteraceae bacterium]|jgi:hypothetical protein
MSATFSFRIRQATADDADALVRLATLDSQSPLTGPVLIGEVDGTPVAALSLTSGRAIADPFRPTAELVALLQRRAAAVHGVEPKRSLRERLGLTATRLRVGAARV